MTKMADPLTILVALALIAMTSPCYGVTVIDLTYQLKEGESITWPVNPRYNFTIMTRGHDPTWHGIWLENNKLEMVEHLGTHMDAPSHMSRGKWRMHQIPSSRLAGPGVVVDITEKVNKNPVYSLTAQDLREWESRHGRMARKAVVLVNTGWGRRYPNWNQVFNTQNIRDISSFRFPSVTTEAASWLAEERDIIAMGIDTPSPDLARDYRLPVHEILLGKNIMILENVGHLERMPVRGTTVVMGGLNIHEGSGAPMRLLALKDMDCDCKGSDGRNGSWQPTTTSALSLVVVIVGLFVASLLQ